MKANFINVVFVIDESGSMWDTQADVIGGFKKVVEEQRANTNGTCSVSYFKFADKVEEVYRGKDINEVEYIDDKYSPGGCTALFDGVGTAIDEVGKWLNSMTEDEKPEKTIVVIMTDGGENSSKEYTAARVKEMIKHQEDKYSWSFVYMGSDLTNANDANVLGLTTRCFASSSDYLQNYDIINEAISTYRNTVGDASVKCASYTKYISDATLSKTKEYAEANGIDVNDLVGETN